MLLLLHQWSSLTSSEAHSTLEEKLGLDVRGLGLGVDMNLIPHLFSAFMCAYRQFFGLTLS